MINTRYDSYSHFYNALDLLLQVENKWEDHTVQKFDHFINLNLGFIVEQTQNDTNAPILKKKLLELSNKINVIFKDSFAHKLAFEIMGIAQGIFSIEEDKIDYTLQLPSEVRQKIYAELIFEGCNLMGEVISISGLESVRLISKKELKVAKENKISCINNGNVSLRRCGYNTILGAIRYIKNNQNLCSANLMEFYLTDEHLKELQDCTWIKGLSISADKITDDGIKFLKRMSLRTVNFYNCHQLTDKAFEYLKEMPLQSVDFHNCQQLTDKALEYLKEMPLQNVHFTNCPLLTDKALEYLKGKQLQSVNFNNCLLLTDMAIEHLKKMKLNKASFIGCSLLTDKAFEYLKGMPLQSINFSYCPLLTYNAFENIREMPLVVYFFGNPVSFEALNVIKQNFRGKIFY